MGSWKPWSAGLVAILAAAGYAWRTGIIALDGKAGGGAITPASRPVPVTTGLVREDDFALSRTGLGTVQAFNTVTVRVRVDGELQKIAFQEGQDVQVGDVLAEIDPRPYQAQLKQAEADKARDEALLANARLDLDRYSSLVVKEFATRQSVDTQKALVAQYEASIARDRAVIDNAQVQLGYTTIVSPLRGRTGIRLIDQGNIVHATDATGLVVITQISPISVIFTLPQQYLPEVLEASRRQTLTVSAYAQDDRTKLSDGQLTLIDNQIDQATGTMRLKATFENQNGALWPGQFVSSRLTVGSGRGAVVPDSAVQSGPNGNYVFVVKQDSTVDLRPIRVAASRNGQALIAEGIKPGETVVTDGQYRLRPGSHVISGGPTAGQRTASTAQGRE
ncbi:efflux RND transporter periplasmic adaptor subunit [Bradyrhizobium sp. USDA 4454]